MFKNGERRTLSRLLISGRDLPLRACHEFQAIRRASSRSPRRGKLSIVKLEKLWSGATAVGACREKKNLKGEAKGIEYVAHRKRHFVRTERASERPFRCEWNTCTVSHLSEKFIVAEDPLKEFSRMRANSTGERAHGVASV